MKNSRPFILVVLVIGFFGLGWWLANRGQEGGGLGRGSGFGKASGPDGTVQAEGSAELDSSPQALLGRLFAKLRAGGISAGELAAYRRAMLNADPAAAMAAIRKFLATGQDALTGESFTLGSGGTLSGAPTFRVLMLDMLGRIGRNAGSQEGAVAARELLQAKTSADEWAVALRNLAWSGGAGDRQMLADKTRELIDHQPWRMQPSAGYFEAFDVIVYLRDTTFIPSLSEMLTGEDDSLQRSAAVALDRLAAMAPMEAMSFLNTHPNELAQKPFLRADYFGKADFSDVTQRQAVEAYLSRADVTSKEKIKMLSVVASPGVFASDNLLTPVPEADIPPERTAALRQSVDGWLQANRFPELTGALRQLQGRMEDQ